MKPIELFERHVKEQVRRHRSNTKSMNLPASVWGDLRPMLERIQNDFNREAVFYEGNKASKETIIYAALQKIEQYYKCGFRKPQSKRLIYVFPDRRNTSELRNIAS